MATPITPYTRHNSMIGVYKYVKSESENHDMEETIQNMRYEHDTTFRNTTLFPLYTLTGYDDLKKVSKKSKQPKWRVYEDPKYPRGSFIRPNWNVYRDSESESDESESSSDDVSTDASISFSSSDMM